MKRVLFACFLLTHAGCMPIGVGVWAAVTAGSSGGGSGGGAAPPSSGGALSAPTGLAASSEPSGEVSLTWSAGAGGNGYAVERREVGAQSWSALGVVTVGTTRFVDGSPTGDTTLEYRVSLFDATRSLPSNVVSLETAPNVVTSVGVQPAGTSVTLSWPDPSAVESGFEVQRSSGGGGFSRVTVLPASSTSFVDQGLQLDTIYAYRVVTLRGLRAAAPSPTAYTATAPASPQGLSSVATVSTRVRVTWTDASATETGFRLERSVAAGPYATLATLGGGTVEYLDDAVSPGTRYAYRVAALNAAGASTAAGPASCLTPASVTSLSPLKGDVAGGTLLTFSGAGLGPAFTVEINGVACTSYGYVSSSTLTCQTPSSAVVTSQTVELRYDGTGAEVGSFFYEGQLPQRVVSSTSQNEDLPGTWIDAQRRIHTIFRRDIDGLGGDFAEVFYVRSADQGQTWTPPVRISFAGRRVFWPRFAGSGTILIAVWMERLPALGTFDAYLARSADGGVTWASPIRFNDVSGTAVDVTVAIDGDLAIAAWNDRRTGQDLYLMRSVDGGATWGPNTPFGPSSDEQQAPSLAIEGQRVLCTFDQFVSGVVDQDVFLIRSVDGGQSWGSPVEVSDGGSSDQENSRVVSSGDLVLVAWSDERRNDPTNPSKYDPDIHVRRSTDGGATWATPSVRLSPDPHLNYGVPSLALDGSLALVAWRTGDQGHAVSADGGVTWDYPTNPMFGDSGAGVRDGMYALIGTRALSGLKIYGVVGARAP